MSKIALSGNASGTGTFTIASPNSNSDRTLNLPDNSGTVLTSSSNLVGVTGVGKVLQVVSATTSTQVSSSTATFVDTGLTASITPSSATSKILVLVQQNGCQKSNGSLNNALDIRLIKDSTSLGTFAAALAFTSTTLENVVASGFAFLDSPATTSSVTYKTDFRSRNGTASVTVQLASAVSSIVLLEIAA
jgi:hypothetical protein